MDLLSTPIDDSLLDDYEEAMEVVDSAAAALLKSVVVETPAPLVDLTPGAEVPTVAVKLIASNVPRKDADSKTQSSENTALKDNSLRKCTVCKLKHSLRRCYKFRKMRHEDKLRHVLLFGYCSRCLHWSHLSKDCKSVAKCGKCQENHHTLLHHFPFEKPGRKTHASTNTKRVKTCGKSRIKPTASLPIRHMVTLSPTLQVKLISGKNLIQVRAVLDLCCNHSYISVQLARQIKMQYSKVNGESYGRVTIRSIYDRDTEIAFTAKISKMAGLKTPLEDVSVRIAEQYKGFQLADPTFYKSGQVALVLGPELSGQILQGKMFSSPGYPLAQYTIFGWVISGLSPF